MRSKEREETPSVPFLVQSPWLRHLRQDIRQPWDVTLEAHHERLEAQMLGIANDIAALHGIDQATARQNATNLLVAEILEMQRRHSPQGQAAMVSALVSVDPGLAGFRQALGMAGLNAEKRAYWRGVGTGLAMVGAALLAMSIFVHHW